MLPLNKIVPEGGTLLITTGGSMSFGPPLGETIFAQEAIKNMTDTMKIVDDFSLLIMNCIIIWYKHTSIFYR